MSPGFKNNLRTFGVACVAIAAYILPTFAWDQASFGKAQRLPIRNVDSAIAIADLDADGRLDLVTLLSGGNQASKEQRVLSWTLTREGFQRYLPIANVSPMRPRLVDVNGDGFTDVSLIVQDSLAFVVGNDTGDIGTVVIAPTGHPVSNVDVADVNNDGVADFIVTADDVIDPKTDVILEPGGVFVRVGSGNFSPGAPRKTGLSHKGSTVTGDFNRDGSLDIVLIGAHAVDAVLGQGDGTFKPVPANLSPPVPSSATPQAADLDGDGNLDLVTAFGAFIFVAHGRGDASFMRAKEVVALDGSFITSFEVADLDRDGDLDLLISYDHPSRVPLVAIVEHLDDGSFGPAEPVSFGGAHGTLADLNGDGLLDIVVTANGEGFVHAGLPTLDDLHSALTEIARLNKQVMTLTGQIKGLTNEIAALRGNLTDTQARLRQAEEKLAEISAALEASLERERQLAVALQVAKNQTATLAMQLEMSKNETSSLTQIILGGATDSFAASALYRKAADTVLRAGAISPNDKRLDDANAALQRAQAAIVAGDYARATKEAERAYDIATSILNKATPINVSPAKPTVRK